LIRRASEADREDVVALWLALTRHHARRDPRYDLLPDAPAEARRLLESELGHPDVAAFLARSGGRPDGLAIVRVERAPPIHGEDCRAEITDLYVAPDARRGGRGRALVEAAVRWARERGAERLEVRVASVNTEGRAFWRALGYEPYMEILERGL